MNLGESSVGFQNNNFDFDMESQIQPKDNSTSIGQTLKVTSNALVHYDTFIGAERSRCRTVSSDDQWAGQVIAGTCRGECVVRRRRLAAYCISQKGHDLTIALCSVMVLFLTMIGLSLLMTHVFGSSAVSEITINEFFLVLYSVSITGIWTLLLLASLGNLTNDRMYRDQSETNFLRGGIICLGTGGVMFYAVALMSFILEPGDCLEQHWDITGHSVAIVFLCSEIALILKYSRIRINKSASLAVMSRFLIVLVIATNICTWVKTLVLESLEEIESELKRHNGDLQPNSSNHPDNKSNEDPCKVADALQHQIQPYTWPLLIEFCVVASTCMIAILERCGQGLHLDTDDGSSASLSSYDTMVKGLNTVNLTSSFTPEYQRMDSHQRKVRYYNSQLGFLLGWGMVVFSLVLIIIYLFVVATDTPKREGSMEDVVFGTYMAISSICLITVPFTMVQMAKLKFLDDIKMPEPTHSMNGKNGLNRARHSKKASLQRVIDQRLLGATNLAQMGFHVMSMIAAVEVGAGIVFANSFVSMMMACLQTIFINWYAMQKHSTTEEHLQTKPGRQGLEVLRCGNLALWLINTFMVKHPYAKRVQNEAFGFITWAVVSNICQPLLILYHFHSVCCLAEIINQAYTGEYITLDRLQNFSNILADNCRSLSQQVRGTLSNETSSEEKHEDEIEHSYL